MTMEIIAHPSPNYDSRDGAPIEKLVLHYTGMPSGEEALTRLCDPQAKVSAHYLVEEDGRIFRLVAESERAWHAGIAYWRGCTDMNARSIGIELVNPGHEWGYRPFPEGQIAALIPLCQDILKRNQQIKDRSVVGHSDIAFRRKQDPGELFPWERLADAGIGLWHGNPPPKDIPRPLACGDAGEHVRQMQEMLVFYGYGMPIDAMYGINTEQVVLAFQRHFRPERVDGVWDGECQSRLEALVRLI